MNRLATAIPAMAMLAIPGCADAPPEPPTAPAADLASLDVADRAFITQAAYAGLGEVAAGAVAARQGDSERVRQFGQAMVTAHAQVNQELAAVAGRKGVLPPTSLDPGRQATVNLLEQLSGAAFDEQYVAQQTAEHELALRQFQVEAASGEDQDLRTFAQAHIADLQQHLEMLRQLTITSTGGQ